MLTLVGYSDFKEVTLVWESVVEPAIAMLLVPPQWKARLSLRSTCARETARLCQREAGSECEEVMGAVQGGSRVAALGT